MEGRIYNFINILIVLSSAYFYKFKFRWKKFYKSSIILKSNNQSFIEIENKFMIDDYWCSKSKYFIDGSQNPINLLNLLYINFLENITSADNLKFFWSK